MEENGTQLVDMKDCEALEDGSNVHGSFIKLIKDIAAIKRYLFKIDIF